MLINRLSSLADSKGSLAQLMLLVHDRSCSWRSVLSTKDFVGWWSWPISACSLVHSHPFSFTFMLPFITAMHSLIKTRLSFVRPCVNLFLHHTEYFLLRINVSYWNYKSASLWPMSAFILHPDCHAKYIFSVSRYLIRSSTWQQKLAFFQQLLMYLVYS
jgi:hypothetical protein